MIPDIKEVNFPKYATLSEASVSNSDMGDKVITASIRIDGSIVPDFSYDWVVEFNGERYIHPLRKPQASKENADIRSHIDLTFRHWAIVELQRYFFVEMASTTAGTAIADKYVASLSLPLGGEGGFIDALNEVLKYWYGDRIRAELFKGDGTHPAWQASEEPTTVSISYTYIWDLLTQLYDIYGCRWQLVSDPLRKDHAVIQFGFPTTELDHIFEYGFKGGLLKIERQVQSDDIRNILLGRGGEKNLPARYFKNTDPDNPSFPADPDWIYELKDIYFDRIRDAAFRSYVQGWKYAHIKEYAFETDKGQFVPRESAAVDWAWDLGYTDEKFNPVEFVRDLDSIAKYGERWGALDDDDDTYPTIQGISLPDIGRVDQSVAIGEVVTAKEGEESSSNNAIESKVPTFSGTAKQVKTLGGTATIRIPISFYDGMGGKTSVLTVPSGKRANFDEGAVAVSALAGAGWIINPADVSQFVRWTDKFVTFRRANSNETHSAAAIPEGDWTAELTITVENTYDKEWYYVSKYLETTAFDITVSFASASVTIGEDSASKTKKYANTFDIWVKNIWQTQIGYNESPEDYADRVWKPILGDREGNTAKVVFSTGWLSVAEDYEFEIVNLGAIHNSIHYDTSKEIDGVRSEWRITLACSDADLDTLGVMIPNERTHANDGDYFYFIGIDLPYLYYTEAEKRLTGIKNDELGQVADIKPTWVITPDKVRIGRKQYDDLAPIIKQLRVGASLRLTDPRFIVEEGKAYELLYIQSITYNYREPNDSDPYIVPDVEIVLSDKYETTANPVSMIQGDVSALQKQLGSISNIEQIVRIVADRLYLRKDGISDLSFSPTQFNSLVTSKDFRIGNIGGAGWGFYRDANGNAVLEIDRAIVRQDFEVNNLVVNQVTARGGMIIESAAAMECTLVVENVSGRLTSSYTCYFDQKQGTVANLFQVNDIAYCQRWDAENNQVKFYKRRVMEVGADYIVLTNGDMITQYGDTGVNGTGVPEEGDNIVQYGNYTNKNRQYVIIRDVVGGGYERFLEGLDSVNAVGDEYYFVGRQSGQDPRFFIGSANSYMQWTPKDGLVVKGKISSKSTYDDSDTELGEAILSTTPYYKQTDSDTDVPVKPTATNLNGFSTVYPSPNDGMFIWESDRIEKVNGKVEFTQPICLTGRTIVGGTNLLYNTNQGNRSWVAYYSRSEIGAANCPFIVESDNVHKGVKWVNKTFSIPSDDAKWQFAQYPIPNGVLEKGKTYVLSFDSDYEALSDLIMDVGVYLSGSTSQLFQMIKQGFTLGGKKQFKFTMLEDVGSEYVALQFTLEQNFVGNALRWRTISIWDLMLEEGTVATDYQPSPHDVDYLKAALKEDGSIEGGLILGSHIRLGYTQEDGAYRVMSGMNGIYESSASVSPLAFWAGGDPTSDLNETLVTYGVRMDGTGFFANNTIRMNYNSMDVGNNVTLDKDGLKLYSDDAHNELRLAITNTTIGEENSMLDSSGREVNVAASLSLRIVEGETNVNIVGSNEKPIYSLGDVSNNSTLNINVNVSFASSKDSVLGSLYVQLLDGGDNVLETYMAPFENKLERMTASVSLRKIVGAGTYKIRYYAADMLPIVGSEEQIISASANIIGDIKIGLEDRTVLGNDGFVSVWGGNTVLMAKAGTVLLRAGDFALRVSDTRGIQGTNNAKDANSWRNLLQ